MIKPSRAIAPRSSYEAVAARSTYQRAYIVGTRKAVLRKLEAGVRAGILCTAGELTDHGQGRYSIAVIRNPHRQVASWWKRPAAKWTAGALAVVGAVAAVGWWVAATAPLLALVLLLPVYRLAAGRHRSVSVTTTTTTSVNVR